MNEWFFAVFTGLGMITLVIQKNADWPKSKIWALTAVLVFAHYTLTQEKDPSQQDFLFVFFTLLLTGYLAFALGRSLSIIEKVKYPLLIVWLAAMVGVWVAILQWTGTINAEEMNPGLLLAATAGDRTPSNIGQANHFGTLLTIALWVVAYIWVQQPGTWWRNSIAVICMTVLVLGIYLSGSRTAHLNLILAPVLMTLWCFVRKKNLRLIGVSLLPIGLLGMIYLSMPTVVEWLDLKQVMEARSIINDPQRLRLWRMALTAISEKPWVGHGFGGMANAHLRLSPEFGVFDYKIATYAHNTLLDLWVVFGLPIGTAIAAPLLWLWMRAGVKTVKAPNAFLWLMCTGLLVHALVEYPLHYAYFWGFMCLLLGALTSESSNHSNITLAKDRPLITTVFSLGILSCLFAVWHGYLATEAVYTLARTQGDDAATHSLQNPDPTGKLLFPGLWERPLWAQEPIKDADKWSDQKVEDLEAATRWHPFPDLIWKVALVHGMRGNAKQAAWWGERLCKMFEPARCEWAGKTWQQLGEKRDNWPTLPWEQWLSKPAPSAPPTDAPSIP